MSKLYRFVKTNDRYDSQIFTFLIPGSHIQNNAKDVETSEFPYGSQKWSLLLRHGENGLLGLYLRLRNATDGQLVSADYSFTLLNGQHFSKNELHSSKGSVFTAQRPVDGRRNVITYSELLSRGFLLDSDSVLLDLEMKNASTAFEQVSGWWVARVDSQVARVHSQVARVDIQLARVDSQVARVDSQVYWVDSRVARVDSRVYWVNSHVARVATGQPGSEGGHWTAR